ncbi:MAG: hypothetical protein AB1782_16120 [Cyanobacteriota bacterium]
MNKQTAENIEIIEDNNVISNIEVEDKNENSYYVPVGVFVIFILLALIIQTSNNVEINRLAKSEDLSLFNETYYVDTDITNTSNNKAPDSIKNTNITAANNMINNPKAKYISNTKQLSPATTFLAANIRKPDLITNPILKTNNQNISGQSLLSINKTNLTLLASINNTGLNSNNIEVKKAMSELNNLIGSNINQTSIPINFIDYKGKVIDILSSIDLNHINSDEADMLLKVIDYIKNIEEIDRNSLPAPGRITVNFPDPELLNTNPVEYVTRHLTETRCMYKSIISNLAAVEQYMISQTQ